jgi:hypothetical protein
VSAGKLCVSFEIAATTLEQIAVSCVQLLMGVSCEPLHRSLYIVAAFVLIYQSQCGNRNNFFPLPKNVNGIANIEQTEHAHVFLWWSIVYSSSSTEHTYDFSTVCWVSLPQADPIPQNKFVQNVRGCLLLDGLMIEVA